MELIWWWKNIWRKRMTTKRAVGDDAKRRSILIRHSLGKRSASSVLTSNHSFSLSQTIIVTLSRVFNWALLFSLHFISWHLFVFSWLFALSSVYFPTVEEFHWKSRKSIRRGNISLSLSFTLVKSTASMRMWHHHRDIWAHELREKLPDETFLKLDGHVAGKSRTWRE